MADERIQKILARAGHGARRACEQMIADGRVTVNGVVVTEPGTRADAESDDIRLDGLPVSAQEKAYYMLNKPAGVLTTAGEDPDGRPTVMQFVEHLPVRVFPVGRLDFDTEGLLLFTNDGKYANEVLHPGHGVEKVYEAVVESRPREDAISRLERGVMLEDGPASPAKVRIAGRRTASAPVAGGRTAGPVAKLVRGTVVELIIHEGRKRIVKRMLAAVGHPVLALRRVAIGGLQLGELAPGELRRLTSEEARKVFVE